MNKNYENVIELFEQGFSPQEIVEETGLKLAKVDEWIGQHKTSLTLAGADDYEEESEFQEPIEFEEGSKNELVEIEKKKLEVQEKKQFLEVEKKKRAVLKKFKRLTRDLLEDVQGSIWEWEDIQKAEDEIESILEQTEELFEFDMEVMEDNSIFEISRILKDEFYPLTRQDRDYQITISWSSEKLEVIRYGMEIDSFDDTQFDHEVFEYNIANTAFTAFMDSLIRYDETKLDSDEVAVAIREYQEVKEVLRKEVSGVDGEFNEELDILENVGSYLHDLSIRIEESFWGAKRLSIPGEIIQEYENLGVE